MDYEAYQEPCQLATRRSGRPYLDVCRRSSRPFASRSNAPPPELSADISDRGLVLTGGGSLLKNLDKRIQTETNLPVSLAEDPLTSVVMGTAKMLGDFNLLRKVSISRLN
jgi:hypothetical protein